MNCKPGDLAIIVKSPAGNAGKIVRCIRFVGKVDGWVGNDRWETDSELPSTCGWVTRTMRDSYLRPIRPDESPEQSLEAMRNLMQTKKEKVTT